MRLCCFVHYSDVIMGAMASLITNLTSVYSTVHVGAGKKKSNLRVSGLCARKSPETGEFPAHMASNAENVSIWWRHHGREKVRRWITCRSYCSAYVHGIIAQTSCKPFSKPSQQLFIVLHFKGLDKMRTCCKPSAPFHNVGSNEYPCDGIESIL